jgi:hypothetical protein
MTLVSVIRGLSIRVRLIITPRFPRQDASKDVDQISRPLSTIPDAKFRTSVKGIITFLRGPNASPAKGDCGLQQGSLVRRRLKVIHVGRCSAVLTLCVSACNKLVPL